jgi:hypothetical protein
MSTLLIGGSFLLLAWIQILSDRAKGARPGIALITFTIAVLLDAIPYFVAGEWTSAHSDLWRIMVPSILYASFVFLIITVVLSLRGPGYVKVGSRTLFVIELAPLVLLLFTLYRGH